MQVTTSRPPALLRIGDLDIAVTVSERRRSVRLTVERDASITAVIPPLVSCNELVRIVKAKRSWLYGKLAEKRDMSESPPAKKYVSGEAFLYLGRFYRLRLVEAPAVRLFRGRLELPDGGGAEDLVGWYRRVGQPWLTRRVQPWTSRMGSPITGLRVRPLGYRWGSCSKDGTVNIHWAVMQLPPTLIDYVLVHELAHLHRRDHGAEFWRIVGRAMPGHEEYRERLRTAGNNLWLPNEPR
ncbi:SprT family zinc-dependent metalloprotease [Micromonospora chalcea]|uniref:M48 family metallopeptidase n=1 Tax=Micromonospora chalcea TaxID=1874 RepID=UPI002379A9AA|nr:SprT family zinc-dependent metalloprotease [Micromonospora chalcea]WDQ02211.1 SprT family zinc-dependent metalloprotease [Micromonospora chalcea]